MKIGFYTTKVFLIGFLICFISGCDNYYHYGINSDVVDTSLKQKDPYFITEDYEFKSILFRSNDENLIIYIRHPLHPIPIPEVFIAQIEIELKDNNFNAVNVENVSFWYETNKNRKVEPFEKFEIPNKNTGKPAFYVLKFHRKDLSPSLHENIKIEFGYKSKSHLIEHSQMIELVKRWSKFSVLINN